MKTTEIIEMADRIGKRTLLMKMAHSGNKEMSEFAEQQLSDFEKLYTIPKPCLKEKKV